MKFKTKYIKLKESEYNELKREKKDIESACRYWQDEYRKATETIEPFKVFVLLKSEKIISVDNVARINYMQGDLILSGNKAELMAVFNNGEWLSFFKNGELIRA